MIDSMAGCVPRLLSDKSHVLFDESWQAAIQQVVPDLLTSPCDADVKGAVFDAPDVDEPESQTAVDTQMS